MSQASQLAHRVREVLLDGYWVANTNYKDQISDVSKTTAITKIHSLNSIAALTFHINYYLDGLIRFLEGSPLDIHDKYSFDLPPIKTEEDWSDLRQRFLENAEHFASLVESMSDELLMSHFVDEKYGSYQRNIECIIEHSYYHLGQVVIIKKMIATQKGS